MAGDNPGFTLSDGYPEGTPETINLAAVRAWCKIDGKDGLEDMITIVLQNGKIITLTSEDTRRIQMHYLYQTKSGIFASP